MAEDPKTVVRAGVDGTGDGGLTTVVTMPIWQMVLVRVTRNYLQVVLGLLTADGLGVVEMAQSGDFWVHLYVAGKVALAPAAVALIQNAIEFLTKLDVNRPGLRA